MRDVEDEMLEEGLEEGLEDGLEEGTDEERGFTLLEVLVALAILGLSLSSMLSAQVDAMRATRYAQGLTAASFLAEYQLIEIEWQMREDGWVEQDQTFEGDFGDEEWPDMRYVCVVDFIELPEYNQLVEAKTDADNATDGDDGLVQDAGDEAFGALGLVWPVVKAAIESSIRKAQCTVYWTDGKLEHDVTVATFWTDPTALDALPGMGGEFSDSDDDSGGASGSDDGGSDGSGATGGSSGGSSGGGARGMGTRG